MGHPNGRGWSPDYGSQGGPYSRDKTHCVQGHEFTPENTRMVRRRSRNPEFPDRYSRVCLACDRAAKARYKIKKMWEELQAEANPSETP